MKGLVYKKLRYPVGGEVRALTRLSGLTYRIVHSTNRTQQFCPVHLTLFWKNDQFVHKNLSRFDRTEVFHLRTYRFGRPVLTNGKRAKTRKFGINRVNKGDVRADEEELMLEMSAS